MTEAANGSILGNRQPRSQLLSCHDKRRWDRGWEIDVH